MPSDAAVDSWPAVPLRELLPVTGRAATPRPPFEALDDPALVAAALDGQPGAFDVLVTRHQRMVYQLCFRFVPNHADAADLAQETFVRAWKGLPGFRGHAQLTTWLHRIAVNLCLNRVSARAPAHEPIEPERHVDASQPDPRGRLLRDERARQVRRAIAALPPKQRAALVLRAYHELSHQEIADLLGSSVGAVKANVFHALGNLRRMLGSAS
jgi:RNA polymerase sigma-70 factor (ECF subfamily)